MGFDLDLTLIDSRRAILAAWRAVQDETGTAIDLAAVGSRMGAKLEAEAAFWFPPEQVGHACEVYRRHYAEIGPPLTTALPGAAAAIEAVRAAGERAVIVTAKSAAVESSLGAAGLDADEIFTRVHGPEKTAVLARIGAAVYVGDTPSDMAAGAAAGACAVGVPTGSFGPAQLTAGGAALVLGSLRKFPGWYAGYHSSISG